MRAQMIIKHIAVVCITKIKRLKIIKKKVSERNNFFMIYNTAIYIYVYVLGSPYYFDATYIHVACISKINNKKKKIRVASVFYASIMQGCQI